MQIKRKDYRIYRDVVTTRYEIEHILTGRIAMGFRTKASAWRIGSKWLAYTQPGKKEGTCKCPFWAEIKKMDCVYISRGKCEDIEICPANGDALCATLIVEAIKRRKNDNRPV